MPTQDQDLHIRDGRQGCIISPARTGNAQKGDSGGPVVTVDGKLHGVIVGGIEGEGNLLTAYGNSTNQSSETIRVPSFFVSTSFYARSIDEAVDCIMKSEDTGMVVGCSNIYKYM